MSHKRHRRPRESIDSQPVGGPGQLHLEPPPPPKSGFWNRIDSAFHHLAKWSSWTAGRPTAFIVALAIILVWLVTGPIFNFDNTWQLVINTGTTIVTFLMVFLIQNTQNRDMIAMQIKLDEVIRSLRGAHNALIDLEDMTDEELERIHAQYRDLAHQAHAALQRGKTDIDSPQLDGLGPCNE